MYLPSGNKNISSKKNSRQKNARNVSIINKSQVSNPKAQTINLPIVAIGASAGGLEAMTELLKNIAPDTGMSFIYVQHLSPHHESILSSLLAKATTMKVRQAINKEEMLRNNVYVIPPDKEMFIMDGHIKLSPRPESPKISLPVDILFTSLAEKHKENVIGIVLSGNGNDGTRGLEAIKSEGGITFAQDDSAKFESMPKNALAAGVVDFVLSPKEIAYELQKISRHPLLNNHVRKKKNLRKDEKEKELELDEKHPDFTAILHHIYNRTGVDFSLYKAATIKRRIQRRMLLHKIKSLKEFLKILLAGKPQGEKSININNDARKKEAISQVDETELLYNDLLITVTNFFRDDVACDYLKTNLFPKLLKSKVADKTLRIWIPGCSTGEEAYSIAMLLLEIKKNQYKGVSIQIFATDLNTKAVSKARIGIYTKGEVENVSPQRLEKFFIKSSGSYRISEEVRELCVFAPHNILTDAPFSHIDFISCCNLLIYFDTAAQKKTIATFHYALNKDSWLVLGKSESIGESAQLFTSIDKKLKLYQRKKNSGIGTLPSPAIRYREPHDSQAHMRHPIATIPQIISSKSALTGTERANDFENIINSVLLAHFTPASVVINQQMEILQFRGETSLYLSHATGKANLNILKMARPEISFELRNTISKAFKTKKLVSKKGIQMNSGRTVVSLDAKPIMTEFEEPLLLIVFSEQEQSEVLTGDEANQQKSKKGLESARKNNESRIKKLEEEIAAYRDELRIIAHNHEAVVEELQSANEEVVSSNEELRSLNEELEASKEEIQSANEELAVTNQELQTRNELLHESYSYSEAIIATLHDPMLVLDKNLRVKTANKQFYRIFSVKEEETEGKMFYNLGDRQWDIPKLRVLLENIIPQNANFENFEVDHTFETVGQKIMLLNARRIVQTAHGEQLILLAIADITELRKLARLQTLEFENAVKERTIELKQSNNALEEKNKELESFNYISSHDLQEPLRKIQAFSGRILEKENQNLSDVGQDYFHRIRDAAHRMQRLIQDLLTFSKLMNEDRIFELTDIQKIIEEIKTNNNEIIEEKKAIIDIQGICKANVIPFQFRQLLENLIINALKFSRPDVQPHILITCNITTGKEALTDEELLPEKKYCHISVSDNGIGFENHFRKKIFEMFQMLHSKEEYSGTGIGLAIAKKIMENHNGIITASSELDKGAKFDIYLPV